VKVNEKLVDLGFFNYDGSEVDDGTTDGILWSHSFTSTPRQFGGTIGTTAIEDLVLDIPSSYLVFSLKLEFEASVSEPGSNESAGIDDLRIISCPAP